MTRPRRRCHGLWPVTKTEGGQPCASACRSAGATPTCGLTRQAEQRDAILKFLPDQFKLSKDGQIVFPKTFGECHGPYPSGPTSRPSCSAG